MPFPAVEGGAGSIDQWPANAGTAMAMSPKNFGPKVADWLGCIAENYGSQALQDAGVISGFKVNDEVTDVAATDQDGAGARSPEIDETVLWFEALMDRKSTSLAQSNVSLLVERPAVSPRTTCRSCSRASTPTSGPTRHRPGSSHDDPGRRFAS